MANAVEQMEADGLTATAQDARCVARLYDAVERNDPAAAAACYAENARFEDVGFQLEGRAAIGRMWDLVWMAAGFRAEHDPARIEADATAGKGEWRPLHARFMAPYPASSPCCRPAPRLRPQPEREAAPPGSGGGRRAALASAAVRRSSAPPPASMSPASTASGSSSPSAASRSSTTASASASCRERRRWSRGSAPTSPASLEATAAWTGALAAGQRTGPPASTSGPRRAASVRGRRRGGGGGRSAAPSAGRSCPRR